MVHFIEPAGDRRATRAAIRHGSSSNPATKEAIESIIVRLNARVASAVIFDALNSLTNFTTFRVVSSIGPLRPTRLKSFLYPGPVIGLISPGFRIDPGATGVRA